MGKIKKICFIMSGYPIPGDMVNTFVDALICEMSRQGIEATVIAPFDIARYLTGTGKKREKHFVKEVKGGNHIEVYCPPYFGVIGNKRFTGISQKIYNAVIIKQFKKISKKTTFDAVYGHFINVGGVPAQKIGEKYGIPSFFACGESSVEKSIRYADKKRLDRCIEGITGIICVSTKNKNEVDKLFGDIPIKDKITVIPNAYNPEEFYHIPKEKACKAAGLSQDDFRVCFTGRFKEQKGIDKLSEALKKCDGVKSIFIGSGPLKPDCGGIDYCGPVDHGDIAKYLCASDVFVLPTKAEGCCNAIVEALGCGLPVISSDLPFNYDILDSSNSIMVNPDLPDEIAKAVMKLKDNDSLREKLQAGAIKKAKELMLSDRANKILNFMEEKAEKNNGTNKR